MRTRMKERIYEKGSTLARSRPHQPLAPSSSSMMMMRNSQKRQILTIRGTSLAQDMESSTTEMYGMKVNRLEARFWGKPGIPAPSRCSLAVCSQAPYLCSSAGGKLCRAVASVCTFEADGYKEKPMRKPTMLCSNHPQAVHLGAFVARFARLDL